MVSSVELITEVQITLSCHFMVLSHFQDVFTQFHCDMYMHIKQRLLCICNEYQMSDRFSGILVSARPPHAIDLI